MNQKSSRQISLHPVPGILRVFLCIILSLVGSARLSGQVLQIESADLVLRNGHLVTVDDRLPEAQALAARGGRIVFVGSNADVERYVGRSTQVIDLGGQLAVPDSSRGTDISPVSGRTASISTS